MFRRALGPVWTYGRWLPLVLMFGDMYQLKIIDGRSMQQTLNPDSSLLWRDVGLFDRISVLLSGNLRRGDIVLFKSPADPEYVMIKRIVALEGDIVRPLPPYPDERIRVPQGHAWVEGDGFHSRDSNTWGPIPLGLVHSRLVCLVWPWWRLGTPLETRPNPRVGGSLNIGSSM